MSIVITDPINYTNIANSIRAKNGLSTVYKPAEMSAAIDALNVSGVINLQDKTVNPSTSQQSLSADTGYDGLGVVTINAMPSGTAGTPVATKGTVSNNSISVTPSVTNTTGYITGGTKTGTAVTVSASELVSGTKNISANGNNIDVTNYALVNVNVSGGGGSATIESLSVTPSESEQTFNSSSVDGYKPVTVGAISSTYVGSGITRRSSSDLTAPLNTVTAPAGYYAEDASKTIPNGSVTVSTKKGTVTSNSIKVRGSVTYTQGFIGSGTQDDSTGVTISASELVSGTLSITTNGTKDVTNYKNVNVNISGDSPTIESLSITPSESEQTFDSSSVDGYKPVTVGAISSTYIGSGITQRDSTDLTASGATVSVPAGYYASSASKAVAGGSATGPSSLSGSSASITTGTNTITLTKTGVTTTPTVSAGYVSSATASTATVALTASVTVNPTPTASGATVTIPAGYYSAQTTKSVSSGSATAPASISGTSATVSTGTNTLTLTKTVSVTPSVSAGYVSSGTAGNSSVSLTASVTTKAAATITPGTSDQTISSGTYLTGTQTISGDADLVAGNIKSGVQIFGVTGSYAGIDTSDATAAATDIVTGKTAYVDGRKVEGSLVIQKYYTGSSAPASSFGNNGDIYFQN